MSPFPFHALLLAPVYHFDTTYSPTLSASAPLSALAKSVAWAETSQWPPTCFSANANEHTYKILDLLEDIATKTHTSPAQVALRWLLQKKSVPSVVIGARTLDQFKDNFAAAYFKLSEDQMAALDAASEIGSPYPYNLEQRYGASRDRE